MTKEEMSASIAAEVGCAKRTAEDMINAFIGTVWRALDDGEKITLTGLGTFAIKHRAARVGRKTVDGKSVPVPIKERDVPTFTPSKTFRQHFA